MRDKARRGSSHAGKARRACSHVGRCRSTSDVRGEDTDDNRSHRFPSAQLSVRSELVGLPGKVIARDARRKFRFDFHEVG